jgi:hypothetical protein
MLAITVHYLWPRRLTIWETHPYQIEVAIQYLNQLIAQSVTLILNAGLISPEAWTRALICPDGMIHDAASRMRCSSVTDTCYLPASPDNPRPCPAKEKGHQGFGVSSAERL